MSSTPQFNGEQLAAARTERWQQGGDALLTLEAARDWIGELGLVLFAPRAHQLATPAPSLVEATLGRAVGAPSAAETETARGLLARMTADGTALPLNLLGGPGDVPDFVASAQVFSYVFTLRGDKSWKQAPSTSGTVKVSPLALKVYELLAKGTAMTAAELVSELGREVTENAVSRALGELWMQLRVIPLLQQDGSGTMWELVSRRFTKPMKAGANAGQPTALSALISVYLAQALAATEEEIETFLSPLSARSRVRDVLHGLTAARQLENVVIEGKTLLYIPGALPEFPQIAAVPVAAEAEGEIAAPAGASEAAGGERIRRFDRPRGPREDRGERPFRREGEERPRRTFRREGEERPRQSRPFGERRREGGTRGGGFGERERRPFQRDRGERGSAEGQSFTRPWEEDRKPRPRRDEGERREGGRPFRNKGEGAGREFRGKTEFRRGPKRDFGGGPRGAESDRGERGGRPFRPRREGEREGAGARPSKPFRRRDEGLGRPESGRDERSERPFRLRREGEREGAGARPSKPFRRRDEGAGRAERGERPFRPRREGDREGRAGRPSKPFGRRDEATREGGPKRPYRSAAEGGERSRAGGERRPGGRPGGKPGFGGKGKFAGKRGPGGQGGGKGKFAGKPKPSSRGRDVKAKDMRSRDKGEGPRGGERKPRREPEE